MAVKLPSALASQEYNPSYSRSPLGGENLDDLEFLLKLFTIFEDKK